MTRFTTLLRAPTAEALPKRVWAQRLLVAFRALQEHAGVDRFWLPAHEPEEVRLEPDALEDLIAARQLTDDDGQPWPALGSTADVLCTDPGGDPKKRPRFRASFAVGRTGEPLNNSLSVDFDDETGPEIARAVLEACVPPWSSSWGCVMSRTNKKARRDEFEAMLPPQDVGLMFPISSLLHWVTYLGPERAARVDLGALEGRSDVAVRSLHEGVEVVLGERWESDAVLRERQRELEPLVFGAGAGAAGG